MPQPGTRWASGLGTHLERPATPQSFSCTTIPKSFTVTLYGRVSTTTLFLNFNSIQFYLYDILDSTYLYHYTWDCPSVLLYLRVSTRAIILESAY
uniref:Uncharacterized protein n=1 Tax=Anguilla anguilla TaxID=7936 RepID=A0A0E9XS30_ANGAN